MKQDIITHLNNPRQLEKMYRTNKARFKEEFSALYPALRANKLADFWNERLNYDSDEINWGSRTELLLVITASVLAWIIAKLPEFLSINEDFFYPRNIGFIVFPLLTLYFAWKNKLSTGKISFIIAATLAGLLFINFLPHASQSDTLILSCIHLILFLWSLLGFTFQGNNKDYDIQRLNFLKYNGDLLVITTLILISGAIMTVLTGGLFSLIGFNPKEFYFKNIAIFALAVAPIIGTYLTQCNPQLVGKVSPVIAKLFSPLVTIMLIIYLIAMVYSGKDPYNDRESLLIFNALLIGVMAIIFFSLAGMSEAKSYTEVLILLILSVLTIAVNCVALSAIVFRISEWGFTPNRSAILGSNILILINLLLVTSQLFRAISGKTDISRVRKTIAAYLPVYFVWAVIVTFLFPLIFGFK
jgi:hypothetical protein